jgi:hypothetical protein
LIVVGWSDFAMGSHIHTEGQGTRRHRRRANEQRNATK